MKKSVYVLVFLIFTSWGVFGQRISSEDSLKVLNVNNMLLQAIEKDDSITFRKISNKTIYCNICSVPVDSTKNSYIVDRNDFYSSVIKSDYFQRAILLNEYFLINGNDKQSAVTVLWTIYKKDEIAAGHQGAQLAFNFKKIGKYFKFTGIETIP
jgi:hypothetical protein